MRTRDIQIRDPFIVPVSAEGRYYLYGTTDKRAWAGPGGGFDCYSSADLAEWEGPFQAFAPPAGFWATTQFWAPEVHRRNGRYFMFASFKADGVHRGTQILLADSPRGPFRPHSDGPVTPRDWECLDGTLFIDNAGKPWMVFCHEWVQVHDGQMCAMPLTDDLRAAAGRPVLLFTASQAPWVAHTPASDKDFVTDGPFLHRTAGGALLMLWSSGGREGYAIGIARSDTGRIAGPWTHEEKPIFGKDGGHGMVFRTFDGRLMLTIHQPNSTPDERAIFLPVREDNLQFTIDD